MNFSCRGRAGGRLALFVMLIFLLEGRAPAQTEPTLLSIMPPNFSSGVPPSDPVIFTFSEAMDPDATEAEFFDSMTFNSLPTSPVWSAGNTVLTCTPTPPFPADTLIIWAVSGQNPNGDPLTGDTGGFFTTGGPGGGTGTNQITRFSLGKLHAYNQTSAAAPSPDTIAPYNFTAETTLASNRSAIAVTLTLPSSAVSSLMQNFIRPEQFLLFASNTNLSSLNAIYGDGNYTFTVQAATSNQQVTVNLPASLAQPNPPQVTMFTAVQSVDPAQPFMLAWDPFQNGTSADYISVAIGTVFKTPDPGTAGALNGTATSVMIPAGTLQPNSTYDSTIGFYRSISNTNNPTYATSVYRGTTTRFNLSTTGSAGGPLVLTNAAWMGNLFSFDVTSLAGQTFSVEYSSNMLTGQWQALLTTNSPPSGRVRITDPRSATNRYLFYRARDGS